MSPSSPHDALWPHLPAGTRSYVADLLAAHPVDVRLSRPRRTKLGDHRPPTAPRTRHRITVNHDLNPYAFLTTLIHEIAHAATWESCQGESCHGESRRVASRRGAAFRATFPRSRIRRVRPHGAEWKAEFERLLQPVVTGRMLPDDVGTALERSMRRPAAATCSDRDLMLALARYDAIDPALVFVESLPVGTLFRTDGGRVFRLGPKLRTRYRCTDAGTGIEYRMHPLCRVTPVGP